MIALKLIAFVLIFRNTLCGDDFDYWPNDYAYEYSYDSYYPRHDPYLWPIESTTAANAKSCLEDESSWTRNDIVDMIHYVKSELNITDITDYVYYKQVEDLRDKYAKNLQEFITNFEERPHHVMHILEIIAETRQTLEPRVDDIVQRLQEFSTHEERFNVVSDSANTTFQLLDKYKEICQLNCENSRIKTGLQIKKTLRNSDSTSRYCFKLSDLYWTIYDKLSQYKENHEELIHRTLEHADEIYNERLETLKRTLKNVAMVKFGTTMYDILSLQDDYYHFEKYIEGNNISMALENIKNNNLVIEHTLIELEVEMEKYRKHCTECDNRRKVSQGIPATRHQNYPWWTTEFETLDDLINSEVIDRVNEDINYDYMQIFEDLEQKLQDADVINSYVEDLSPIQRKITYEIENEEHKLEALKNEIPPSSIAEISELLQKSEELLDKLASAKAYISQFI